VNKDHYYTTIRVYVYVVWSHLPYLTLPYLTLLCVKQSMKCVYAYFMNFISKNTHFDKYDRNSSGTILHANEHN